jgi:hypothetical protein
MKNVLVIMLAVLALGSCKKLKQLTVFEAKYDVDLVIPANSLINIPISVLSPDMNTNIKETVEANDSRIDKLESVKIKSITLLVTSPSGKTFSFLKDAEIYLGADGMPEVLIAVKQNIPNSVGSELQLDVTDTELLNYIKKDKITFRANVTTDEVLTQNVNIKAKTVFLLDAKILGL